MFFKGCGLFEHFVFELPQNGGALNTDLVATIVKVKIMWGPVMEMFRLRTRESFTNQAKFY